MATELHNLTDLVDVNIPDASNMNFGIVVADWNHEITGALLQGAVDTLEQHGALPENIHVKHVPGSFELIYGAQQMSKNDGFDAIIILGSVIRGENSSLRLHLPGRDLWYRSSQCHAEHSGNLWSSDHKRPATGKGKKWWKTWKQGC